MQVSSVAHMIEHRSCCCDIERPTSRYGDTNCAMEVRVNAFVVAYLLEETTIWETGKDKQCFLLANR